MKLWAPGDKVLAFDLNSNFALCGPDIGTPAAWGAIGDGVGRPLNTVTSIRIGGEVVSTLLYTLAQWQALLPAATSLTDYLDRVALQSLINASAGQRTVLIPAGMTILQDRTITLPGKTSLEIDGLLILAAGVNSHNILLNPDANDVLIHGVGVIDGNKAHQAASNVGGLPNSGGNGGICTWLFPAPRLGNNNVTISGITIRNTFEWPISLNGVSNGKVTGCTFTDCNNAGQFAFGSVNCIASGNFIRGCPDYAWACYEGCSFCTIANNISEACGPFGVLSDGDASVDWQNVGQHDITVVNNICRAPTGSGVTIATVVSGGQPNFPYNITVQGNAIENAVGVGIVLAGVRNSIVAGNVVTGGAAAPDGTYSGIAGIAQDVLVAGNVFNDVGRLTGSANNVAINVANWSNCIVSGNYIFDTSNSMRFAFDGALGTRMVFINNALGGNAAVFGPAFHRADAYLFVGPIRDANEDIAFSGAVIAKSIEVGRDDLVNTPVVDFHCGNNTDRDARIEASGGVVGTPDAGHLAYTARAGHAFTGPLNLTLADLPTADPHVLGKLWVIGTALQISLG